MARISNLMEMDDSAEILTSTRLEGGLLGGGEILATDPLETYLQGREEPKYALRNKKSGLEIERPDGRELIEPDENLQAVALVTDLRALFAVGREDGDRVIELPLSQIVEAKSEPGRFRTNALVIATVDDELWRFTCKANVDPVAKDVDGFAQVWNRTQRLLDEAETQVSNANDALMDNDMEGARRELGDAKGKIETAVTEITEVGPAAAAKVKSRARAVSDWLLDIKREFSAHDAAEAHAQAQREWKQEEYESAARNYEHAIESYDRALSTSGPSPSDKSLEKRLNGAIRERELLRVGPLVDADSARRRAIDEEDPEEAAAAWGDALDGYRELLSLDWGKETREFLVDRDKIREQTISIADDAVEDHLVAGQQWVHSGDRLAVDGHAEQAREVYERARSQLERAEQIAREVRPEQLDDIEAALEQIDDRLSGTVPDEIPADSPLETVDITGHGVDSDELTGGDVGDEHSENAPNATFGNEGGKTLSATDSESEAAQAVTDRQNSVMGTDETGTKASTDDAGVSTAERSKRTAPDESETTTHVESKTSESERSESDKDQSSLLDQLRSKKQQKHTTSSSAVDSSSHGEGEGKQIVQNETDDQRNRIDSQRNRTREDGPATSCPDSEEKISGASDTSGAGDTSGADDTSVSDQSKPDVDTTKLENQLNELTESEFDKLVAELWESQGWATTIVSVVATTTFDIVALRDEPTQERLGFWTVHRPNEPVETTAVDTCIGALKSSEGADAVTIVTTGEVTTAAQSKAEQNNISIVDTTELVELLRFEGVTDKLESFGSE